MLDPAEMVQNCVNWCSNNVTDGNEFACGFFNFEVSKFIPNPWLMRIWLTQISLLHDFSKVPIPHLTRTMKLPLSENMRSG